MLHVHTPPRHQAAMPCSHVNSAVRSGDSYRTKKADNERHPHNELRGWNKRPGTSSYLCFLFGVAIVLGFYSRVTSHKPFFAQVQYVHTAFWTRNAYGRAETPPSCLAHRAMLQHSSGLPAAMIIICLVIAFPHALHAGCKRIPSCAICTIALPVSNSVTPLIPHLPLTR